MFIPFRITHVKGMGSHKSFKKRKLARGKNQGVQGRAALAEKVEESMNRYLEQEFFKTLKKHLFDIISVPISDSKT